MDIHHDAARPRSLFVRTTRRTTLRGLTVSNLAVPFYTGTVEVRRSTTLKLSDPNLSFEYPGRSSLIGKFEYSGP